MTGHYRTAAHASTPTLFRETSAFLMKANYQRHMLYGWVVALCAISIPTLLISAWPVADIPPVKSEPVKRDTVSVVWDNRDIVITSDRPVGPCGQPPPKSTASGLFVDNIKLIADSLDNYEDLPQLGPAGSYEEGPFGEDDLVGFMGGNGGTVYIPDTSEYRFNSAELDRPPVLIAMDQPEYPRLAKRAEVDGRVLLHILVNAVGRVDEVRIESESNPDFGFGESAARAARSAVFSPAIANRQPVRCWVAIPVVYEME